MSDETRPRPATRTRTPHGSLVVRISIIVVPVVIVALLAWQYLPSLRAYYRYHPLHGDIIFQSMPEGAFARLIEGATHSPVSHCGIVVERDGTYTVLEALGRVHETGLSRWTRRGRGGAFLVCRLKPEHEKHVDTFVAEALKHSGKPYDSRFRMDDEALYCSELVFKAYRAATGENLGETCRVRDLDWEPHKAYIEQLEGGPVPLDREMITPVALTRAAQVEVVCDYGLVEAER